MNNSKKTLELTISSGKVLKINSGLFAPQANGAVMATLGGTTVLATVVMGNVDETKDYFPLSVEFQDKLYASGTIRDSKWIKREGGLDDESILMGRLIDRSIRPLFPKAFKNEVQVIVSLLSNDKLSNVSVLAFNAVSIALALSDIPFNGPVSASQVGLVDNQIVINPTIEELSRSSMDLVVCTGPFGVNMIEAGADIVEDSIVLGAIDTANQNNLEVNKQITAISKDAVKRDYKSYGIDPKLLAEVETKISQDLESFYTSGQDDGKHVESESVIFDKLLVDYQAQIESKTLEEVNLKVAFEEVVKNFIRSRTLKGTRFDRRGFDDIRPVSCTTSVLSHVHGSALFQRGLTQALTITALGPLSDEQSLNSSFGDKTKRYMHFYNALPFSTGQTGRLGRPGRREVGHGALAEKALLPVIPSKEKFPYTILVNSEVLSQNGSSSMASTCGSTLSLMDAGVPIKDMVGGVSIGMMSEGDKYTLLTDIAGIEDHNGDMDFKITGTKTGITAIQLDVKRPGLTMDMIKDTFTKSRQARLKILETMSQAISTPRPQLSDLAPKIIIIRLPEDKIGEVIGPGGKMIKGLMKKYQVQIDIDDEGMASISSSSLTDTQNCATEIENMVREFQIGEEFDGTVTRVEPYGAFVEMVTGREALLHVSEMATGFINNPGDLIKVGDKIHVEIAGRNQENQIKLSAKKFKSEHVGQANPATRQPTPRFSKPVGRFNPAIGGNRVTRTPKSN